MGLYDLQNALDPSPITAASTLLVLGLGILYFIFKNRGLPPGPIGLPYLGYYPFLKNETAHLQLQELMKKYGDVYSFTSTGRLHIHLGTTKAVKEAHVTKGDCFTMRYNDFSVLTLVFGESTAALNGEPWKVIRKFFVQGFREFGLTSMKDYMAGPIYDSMNTTVNRLRAEQGKPVNVISILTFQSCTILRRMLFNDDGITEEELRIITENYEKLLSLLIGKRSFLHGEFARRVIFPLMPEYKPSMESHRIIIATLKKIIKRHEESFHEDSIRDLIDNYIKERIERWRKNDPTSEYFTENSLASSLLQFIGDGTSAIAIFIGYFFYALLEYPEEQDKLNKELEEVVGPGRLPTLEDKNKLVYMNAFIQEVMRTTDFFTLLPSLECTRETIINGCKVPVGSITVINFWACHRDSKAYENPDEFRPSRYISEPGKKKPELPILFGVGKRSCAGESFTMMQVFLFVTTIIKNFRLIRPKNCNKKSFMDGKMEVILQPRKQDSP